MMDQISLSELSDYLHFQAEDTFPALKDEQRLAMLAEKWYHHAEFCTCRDDSGQLVGMIAFYANQPETGIAYIPHIYVSPAYRGRGIFSQMFQKVVAYVKQKGYTSIKLEVSKDNMTAQKAYIKQGFQFLPEKNRGVLHYIWRKIYNTSKTNSFLCRIV